MQQLDIFDVFKEQDDIEIVRQQLAMLQPGQNITTNSFEVRMSDRFIEVECTDLCHELFHEKDEVLKFIINTLEEGIEENKKTSEFPPMLN